VAVAFARFTAVFFPSLSPNVFLGATINLGSGPIQVGLSPAAARRDPLGDRVT